MKSKFIDWTALTGGFLGGLSFFIGGIDNLIYALIVFVVVDYITGVARAIVEKELSSRIGAKGILKKMLIFCLVGVSHILDSQVIGEGSLIRTTAIVFYIANEGVSILENSVSIGLPIPSKLKRVLKELRESTKEEK